MKLNTPKVRNYLKEGSLERLFIEELGWDRHLSTLSIEIDGCTFTLEALAEKRGVQIFECNTDSAGNVPNYSLRRKIEKQVTKSAYEHLIIFVDHENTVQIWQWVARQPGKPAAYREHVYYPQTQSGDALLQKLEALTIPLDEEEGLDLRGTIHKLKDAFDRDRLTKKFYDQFKKEQTEFKDFINGIEHIGDLEWYASLMLNRLMFIYFIQRKGFLDGDQDYLHNRLKAVQARKGRDRFHTFYRYFLLELFHEGFSKRPEHRKLDHDLHDLLGNIPFLNGGLFEVHELEEQYPDINIPDDAFQNLFAFFNQYEWHLDSRPLRNDREINPDVLGYIFEKYINQRQMGAFYTKEDVTDYISKYTIIPYIFDNASNRCSIAFDPNSALWSLVQDEPGRYLYPSIRKGVMDSRGGILPIPEIIDGSNERADWSDAVDLEYGLPRETWHEFTERRQRCLDIRDRLVSGEIARIDDFVTLNLDIRQFAEDAIVSCEGPELLRAVYNAIRDVTILDPTCGSGAFLFAALNILEPLYEACLDRMQAFIEDQERAEPAHSKKHYEDFKRTLAETERHPSRTYFILKSIIINNLYGVDIMPEAVEICKLRLFLNLVAQVDDTRDLEPLPDIDFNIRTGNTLVGFAALEDVRKTIDGTLGFGKEDVELIVVQASEVEETYQRFQEIQTKDNLHSSEQAKCKQILRDQLHSLSLELDRYLASEYGVNVTNPSMLDEWIESHRPFHWFAEFHNIMSQGGFDVVIGNPPWKKYSLRNNSYIIDGERPYHIDGYSVVACGNLYAVCIERALALRSTSGRMSFIVQLPFTNSTKMASAREYLRCHSSSLHILPFDDRPGKLFDGLEHCRSVIFISAGKVASEKPSLYTSRYQRWYSESRPILFSQLRYIALAEELMDSGIFPKYDTEAERSVLSKIHDYSDTSLSKFIVGKETKYFVFYLEATGYWVKATIGLPFYARNGSIGAPPHGRYLFMDSKETTSVVSSVLNSSLFYSYFIAYGDGFHLSDHLVSRFPIPSQAITDSRLVELGVKLQKALKADATKKTISLRNGTKISYEEYFAAKSKSLIDEIDSVLAEYYHLSDLELGAVSNYDARFRS